MTDLALPLHISSSEWLFYQKFIATSKSQIHHYIKGPSRGEKKKPNTIFAQTNKAENSWMTFYIR